MKHTDIRTLCEGAICIALTILLSYLEIKFAWNGEGGSVSVAMLPLVIFAVRYGVAKGIGVGAVAGFLKFILANGVALHWVSILFDYAGAYALVGLAGCFRGKWKALPWAALLGGLARFAMHFLSGITVYASYMPEQFLNQTMTSVPFYSFLYNGLYMFPSIALTVLLSFALRKPLAQFFQNLK